MNGSSRIPLLEPSLHGNEAKYLQECVDTNYVSSVGPFVERFERAFAEAVGTRHAIACASGTAALHVALACLEVGQGQEVAVSTLTFIASANAARYTAADVLLVDSDWETWNLDGGILHDEVVGRARRGDPLPAAIEPVHVLGHPVDMEPILALRDEYGIPIVEDAAEALGGSYVDGQLRGRQVGTLGDLGCFSFNGNKIITSGGGGMVVTNDSRLADRARHLVTQARVPGLYYVHDDVGFNYRLTNVAAAVGLAQLEQLETFLERKRSIAARYDSELEGLPLGNRPDVAWASPSQWLYTTLVDKAVGSVTELIEVLSTYFIEARPVWLPVHQQMPYRTARRLGGSVSEAIASRGICLPCSPGLTDDDQGRVIDVLRTVLSHTNTPHGKGAQLRGASAHHRSS